MKLRAIGALTFAAVVVFAAAGCSGGSNSDTLKLGVTLPLSGGAAADGQPTLKGAQLAVEQINAKGGIGGKKIQLVPLDHAVNGKYNEQQGAQDMQTLVGDAAVIGVVGPYNSAVAKVQIPIGNKAGLLQCSPANTNMSLTLPEFGAGDFRKDNPTKNNYVRVAANDTIQGPAMAVYAYNKLGLKNLMIIDDVTTFG
jgi:branched-chain amino acid transport system substrate-binding protein